MPDSADWQGLAAAFSYPGTGPGGTSWEDALPASLARRARELGREQVEQEHVRLFVNGLPEVPCPPYASWYREDRLMGETASRLRQVYRRWGVDVRDEAPDHIAVQLAFVAALMNDPHGTEARAEAVALLRALREWTPRLFRRLREHDRTGFYAAAADLCGRALAGAGTLPEPRPVESGESAGEARR